VPALALLLAGCETVEKFNEERDRVGTVTEIFGTPTATASTQLASVGSSGVVGRVSFEQFGAIVIIRARVFGLRPNAAFGLHVLEARSCAHAADMSPSVHFNPGKSEHGRPGRGAHHAGDLPNLTSDGESNAVYAHETSALSVTAGPTSVVGRVLTVSSRADDFRTQPDGNSGPPLACGFIRSDAGPFGVPIK
jgi:Cu-Zn family superoxide dismutase